MAVLVAATITAAARPVHIVAFGDSATAGWLVPRKEAYPAQLQAALRKKGYDVVVDQCRHQRRHPADALKRFDQAIGPDTDIAIVEFGTNDLRRRVSMKPVRARLTEIIRALRARNIEVLLIGFGEPQARRRRARPKARSMRNGNCRRANIAPATAPISTPRAMPSWSRACCRRSRHCCNTFRPGDR